MRILAIPIIKHGNKVNRKREIFRCHFLHLNSLSLRRQTFENCPHYSENSLPKKKLQLGENYESYPRILQSVPIILKHTLVSSSFKEGGESGRVYVEEIIDTRLTFQSKTGWLEYYVQWNI